MMPCNYCFREFASYSDCLDHEKSCKSNREKALQKGKGKFKGINFFRFLPITTKDEVNNNG